ncbi:MAG: MFS transporter [Pseudomonadota bacterium]
MALRISITLGAAFLLLIVFGSNVFFLESTLIKNYEMSEISRFIAQARKTRVTVEQMLNSERRRTVTQMSEALEEERLKYVSTLSDMSGAIIDARDVHIDLLPNMSILLKNGTTLISTDKRDYPQDASKLFAEQIERLANGGFLSNETIVEYDDTYFIPQLLYSDSGAWIGSLMVLVSRDTLAISTGPKSDKHLEATLVIGAFGFIYIVVIVLILFYSKDQSRTFRKKFVLFFLLVMIATMLWSILHNLDMYQQTYLAISKDVAATAISEIEDANVLENSAVEQTSSLSNLDELGDYAHMYAEFEAIKVVNNRSGDVVFYKQVPNENQSLIERMATEYLVPGIDDKDLWVSRNISLNDAPTPMSVTVFIKASQANIVKKSSEFVSNGLTLLLVSVFLAVELLLFYVHLLRKHFRSKEKPMPRKLGFIRPAIFMFLFGIDLSMAFVPLHMQSLSTTDSNFSQSFLSGLPISTEFLFVGIFILIAGLWVDRRGWFEPFLTGLLVAGCGTMLSWFAADPIQFVISRAFVGAGFGLTLMASQGFVIELSGSKGRATGLANLFAGLYAGSLCGAATGSILAERMEYSWVFLIGALIVLLVVPYALFLMRTPPTGVKKNENTEETAKPSFISITKFVFHPFVLGLSVLSSLPSSIAVAGFLNFFTPVYLDEIGETESTIGQVLILYGICLIFLGPTIGKYIDKSHDKKKFMVVGGILGAIAFIAFDTSQGVYSVVMAVLLLGLSTSFVLPSQSTIMLDLEVSKTLGAGKALGIFRSISRIGQVVGPLIFGWVMFTGEITETLNYIGLIYLAAMLPLLLFTSTPVAQVDHEKTITQPKSG